MRVLFFPGQGSQKLGMGNDLYQNFSEAKYVFHEVDDTLRFKLSDLMFNGDFRRAFIDTKYSTCIDDNWNCCFEDFRKKWVKK